jgi:O-antigen/teichoic acid export membrane protein
MEKEDMGRPVVRLRNGKGEANLGRLGPRLETLWQGGWILVATIITGILNYLANVLVARMLEPADYGVYASLVSLFVILVTVGQVLQTVVATYVARLQAQGRVVEIGSGLVYLSKRMLFIGVGGTLLLLLASRSLSAFLRFPSSLPMAVFSLLMIPGAVLPVVNGALRGLQRFGALGGTQIGLGALRLATVIGLAGLGLGAAGAVASLPLASLGSLALGTFFVGDVLRRRGRDTEPGLGGLLEFSLNAALAMTCFAILVNSDVIIVKSRFSPSEAGLYSAVATLGKTIFWLSGSVAVLLLPKATERHARGQSAVGLARRSLLAVGLLCGTVVVLFFLFPLPIVRAFLGKQYAAGASFLGLYGLAVVLFSLANVWLAYCVAVQQRYYAYILLAGVLLLVSMLIMFGSSLTRVAVILVGIGVVLYLGGEALLLADRERVS